MTAFSGDSFGSDNAAGEAPGVRVAEPAEATPSDRHDDARAVEAVSHALGGAHQTPHDSTGGRLDDADADADADSEATEAGLTEAGLSAADLADSDVSDVEHLDDVIASKGHGHDAFAGLSAAAAGNSPMQGALPLDVRTGDARVDAAVAQLVDLDRLPVADHALVFTEVHRALQDALVDLDRG